MPEKNSYNKNIDIKRIKEEKEGEKVHISSQLSSKMIVELMDEYFNLKKISCPPSIYKRISKKYLEVLKELGISVEVNHNWGSKRKYNNDKKKKVSKLVKQGKNPSQIAEKLNLPLKTIYYLKDRSLDEKITLKIGKKSKYSDVVWTKIRNLANSGVSPQKISKKENIPIRTVYYMINNK